MKIIIKAFTILLIGAILLPVNTQKFKAQNINRSMNNCMNSQLNVDKTNVEAGREIKFTLDYQSVEPVCSADDMKNESLVIDFSQLVGDYGTIDVTYDTKIFNIVVDQTGVVTITFKTWDQIHNTLEHFEGNMVFTILVSSEISGGVVIENDISSDITITVDPPSTDTSNTSKWADESYAQVGDVLNYNVRINTEKNQVTTFKGIDTPAKGLNYVDNSAYVTNLKTNDIIDSNLYKMSSDANGIIFENLEPFNQAYVIHYQMLVTSANENYQNQFKAIYDTNEENGGWTVDFDSLGSGDVSLVNGQIDILKTDEEAMPLQGAEFNVINSDNVVVDHIVSNEDGHAVTEPLALGEYKVIETVAPENYVLDSTEYNVEISETPGGENISNLTIVNQSIQSPDIELPIVVETGSIEITKLSEDGDVLEGAQFDVTDSTGKVVDKLTTNKYGIATSLEIPLGRYYITETKAPNGYMLNDDRLEVNITKPNQIVSINVVDKLINKSNSNSETVENEQVDDEENEIIVGSQQAEENERNISEKNARLETTGDYSYAYIIGSIFVLNVIIYIKSKLYKIDMNN